MADTEINALPDAAVALGDFAHLNDISNSNASFRETIQNILALYDSLTATMSNKTLVAPVTDDLTFTGRCKLDKGADVASATNVTLGADGNSFDITGTTTIETIVGTNWAAGNIIHLHFDGILTVTHNSGGTNDILLGDQSNMTTAVGDVLTLQFDGTDWREVSRSVVSAGGSGDVTFDSSETLAGTASTITLTLSDSTKNIYEADIVLEYSGASTDELHLRINGLSTAIYDYEHNRFFSGGSDAATMVQGATEAIIDDGSKADGDQGVYHIRLQKFSSGWFGVITGSRFAATTHVRIADSFFVATTNALTSITILDDGANDFAIGSAIKAWKVNDS